MSSSRSQPRVSFASLTPNNLGNVRGSVCHCLLGSRSVAGTVRKLNSVLFPIKYSERFYTDILKPEVEEFCKLGSCYPEPYHA